MRIGPFDLDVRRYTLTRDGEVVALSPRLVELLAYLAARPGVIVSKDGYVLTAGHVSGPANRDVAVVFPDGKTVKGKTLGGNHGIDSGMIKITDEGEWPFVEMGKSAGVPVAIVRGLDPDCLPAWACGL